MKKISANRSQWSIQKAKAKRPFRLAVLQLETYDGVFYDAHYLIKKSGHCVIIFYLIVLGEAMNDLSI